MGNCGDSVNCTDLYTPVSINVLPDIVGIGILTSFSVTAGAAFGTLLYSYFTDSLAQGSLSWADWGFLQTYHTCKACRIRYGAINKKGRRVKKCNHNEPKYDNQRREGVNAFMLNLSDQQLVTGPAMIVAALVQHCQLSVYEFQVVNGLAFLSSTTHLATLVMLRQYLKENKVVRNIRVLAMILNLGLLTYTTIVAYTAYSVDNSVPIQCVMDSLSSLQPDPFDFANTVVTVMFLFVSYGQCIMQLYSNDEENSFIKRWLRHYCHKGSKDPRLDSDDFEQWYEKGVIQSRQRPGSDAQRHHFWCRAMAAKQNKRSWYYQILLTAWAVWFDFQQSFLGEIPALLMSCSLAVTQVAFTRIGKPDVQNNENLVDFGQIVPIFLLFLPVLAMVETYFETHPGRAEKDQGSLKNIPPKLGRLRNKFQKTLPRAPVSSLSHGSAIEQFELGQLHFKGSLRESTEGRSGIRSTSTDRSSNLEIFAHDPALDPIVQFQYRQRDVQIYLNLIFWVTSIFSFTTGIMLSINATFSIVWSVLTALGLIIDGWEYCYFFIQITRKARAFKLEKMEAYEQRKEEPRFIKITPINPAPPFAVWERLGRRDETQDRSSTVLASGSGTQNSAMSGGLGSESPGACIEHDRC